MHDLHQMGARAARLFAPPYVDPWEPNVDPALIAAVNALGTHVAARLTAEGKKGVAVTTRSTTPGARRAPIRTPTAASGSSRRARRRAWPRPIEVPFEDLEPGIGYDPRVRSWNFPDPWPGGTWRLRDIVDYQRRGHRAIARPRRAQPRALAAHHPTR